MRRKKREGKRMWMRTSAWILAVALLLADAPTVSYASADSAEAPVQEGSSGGDTEEKQQAQELQEKNVGVSGEPTKLDEPVPKEKELKVEETPALEETGTVESEAPKAMATEQSISEEDGAGIDLLADGAISGTYRPYEGAKYTLRWSRLTNADGSYGDEVRIWGIKDYDSKQSDLGDLVIPEEINGRRVVEIGYEAFRDCSGFTGALKIPGSVVKIGENAFWRCEGFTSLEISEGVTEIGRYAFGYCSGFAGTLRIPGSVKEIDGYVFEGCSGFTSLEISEGVTKIGADGFRGYSGFTGTLKIPGSVKEIGNRAFVGCSGFTSLEISEGVTEIGLYAFADCSGFTGTLKIPESAKEIYEGAFEGCNGFTSLEISEGVTKISSNLFNGCSNFTGTLKIPESVAEIGDYAFSNCSGFTGTLKIPGNVAKIGDTAFAGCKGFSALEILEGVTKIGCNAFSDCSGFTGTLKIPGSVAEIGDTAFAGCKGFSALEILEGVTKIGNRAFAGCSGLKGDLVIPEGMIEIGRYAFADCSNLTGTVKIPGSLTEINSYIFADTSFTGLAISESVTEISYEAFCGCSNFRGTLRIPESVTEIGEGAFSGCSGFASLEMSVGVTKIGDRAFAGCSGLEGDLVIPKGVTKIGDRAFAGCSGLEGDLVIPEGVTEIGEYVFDGCIGLTGTLEIPASVAEIGRYTFDGCKGFSRMVLGAQKIDYGAFVGFTNLRDIVITSVKEWGGSVFGYDYAYKDYPVRTFTFMDADAVIPEFVRSSYSERWGGRIFIRGYRGSTAETYAKEHACVFIPLDGIVPEITEIKVSNTQELLDAIGGKGEGSYRRIILADGVYCMPVDHEVKLYGLASVTIEAEHTGQAEILAEAGYRPAMTIYGCKDIDIKGCILGHTVERGGCDDAGGFVLSVENSYDINIDKCDFFGCGTVGIYSQAENINVSNSVIRDTMYTIANGRIFANGLKFQNCIFSGNSYDVMLEYVDDAVAMATQGDIALENCIFVNNMSTAFSDPEKTQITMEQCSFGNNKWDGLEPKAGGICLNGITWQIEDDVLKIGYPLQLDDGTVIQSKQGKVLDYSEYSSPWKIYDDLKKIDIAPGIQMDSHVKINVSGIRTGVTVSMSKEEEQTFISGLIASEGITATESDWFRVDITVAEDMMTEQQKDELYGYASKRGYSTYWEYMDISVNLQTGKGETIQITQTDIPVRIVIETPKYIGGAENMLFSVIRMHDGEFTILKDLDDDPDTITIETDRFSPYVIAYREAGSRLKGDVNGDDEVDAKDKRLVYNHINASSPEHELTGEAFLAGDVDDSGEIDAKDKRMIYNHIAGTDLRW